MTNLLIETVVAMTSNGKTPDDVSWVGTLDGEYVCTWEQFADVAAGINYDNGYGGQEIQSNLTIVGKKLWWLERGEYDGAEWWEYKIVPLLGPEGKIRPLDLSKIYSVLD